MEQALEKYARRDARRRETKRQEALAIAGDVINGLKAENEKLKAENAKLKARVGELESEENEFQDAPPEADATPTQGTATPAQENATPNTSAKAEARHGTHARQSGKASR